MDMQRTNQFTVGIGNQDLIDTELFHQLDSVHRQLVWVDGARSAVHDIGDSKLGEILALFEQSAQVTVWKYADRAIVIIDHRSHGHAFAGDFHECRRQRYVWLDCRYCVATAHDVAHMREQSPSERAAWVRTGEILFLEAACIQQRYRQGVTHGQRCRGAGRWCQIESAGFLCYADIEMNRR